MEQWSILSNMLNYVEHDILPQNFHNLGISTVNICKNNSGIEEENVIEVGFGPTPNVLTLMMPMHISSMGPSLPSSDLMVLNSTVCHCQHPI